MTTPPTIPPPSAQPNPLKMMGAVAGGVMLGCFGVFAIFLIGWGIMCNGFVRGFNESTAKANAEARRRDEPAMPMSEEVKRELPQPPPPTPAPSNGGGVVVVHSSDAQPPNSAESPDAVAARFAAVAQVFEAQGCTVEHRGHGIVYIYLPTSMALTATPVQAKELALAAYSRLGSDFLVKIKTPQGQTLAEADVWGTR